MARIRYRLRTIMIIVAFVALVLVVVIQGVYLRRARVQIEMYRSELASWRAWVDERRRLDEQARAAAVAQSTNTLQAQELIDVIDRSKRFFSDPATKAMLDELQERAKYLIEKNRACSGGN